MNIKQYLWTLPFISFVLGYKTLSFFISGPTIDVPTVLGKSASEALSITSNNNLSIKIIGEKEDPDLPTGTILYQAPINQKIKRNQSIYVLTSKQPPKAHIPNLLQQTEDYVDKILLEKKIKAKKYYIDNCSQYCFAQYPVTGQEVTKENAIIYFGNKNLKPCLFPDLKGENIYTVIDFLKLHGLTVKVYRHGLEVSNYHPGSVVVKQKPLPGSIVSLKNISTVLLEIS